MFRCSPSWHRGATSQARQLYFVFCRLFSIAFMPFKNIGTNLSINAWIALHSRCSTSIGSFAGQAQAKSAASAPSDTGTLPNRHCICHFQQVLNPAQFSSQSDVQPASNAACSSAAYFRFACSTFVGVLGFYGRVLPVSGCPHDPLPLAKSVQSFHDFDVFFVWELCLRA